MYFPNLYSPSWIEKRFSFIPTRMSDTNKLVWLKSYYILCAWNPFVDMCEHVDTYQTSLQKSYLIPFKKKQDKWRCERPRKSKSQVLRDKFIKDMTKEFQVALYELIRHLN